MAVSKLVEMGVHGLIASSGKLEGGVRVENRGDCRRDCESTLRAFLDPRDFNLAANTPGATVLGSQALGIAVVRHRADCRARNLPAGA